MEALIERMSPQELINSLGLLQRRGALADPNLKAMIDLKLEEAKRDKRVSTFKAEEAVKAVPLDADTRQEARRGSRCADQGPRQITRPTALLIDKSGSMELAIDVGKRIGAYDLGGGAMDRCSSTPSTRWRIRSRRRERTWRPGIAAFPGHQRQRF